MKGSAEIITQAKTALNNLIEAAAIMIVTSCVFPIVVMLFFKGIISAITGMQFSVHAPRLMKFEKHPELE